MGSPSCKKGNFKDSKPKEHTVKSCVTNTTLTSHPETAIITFHSHEKGATEKHRTLHKDTHINISMYLFTYLQTNQSEAS